MALTTTQSCVVIFSGGQDSTTCLHWALKKFKNVYPVFFDYGQRHLLEKKSAQKICKLNKLPLKIIKLNLFKDLGGNSLTDHEVTIKAPQKSLPNTFVPGRNIIFITSAAAYAWKLGTEHLITGVCQADYSGYPDCRENTMKSLAKTLSLGMDSPFKIHTPLMKKTKAESIKLAEKVNALGSLAWSHTCYEGVFPPCGKCPACLLRKKGFKEAEVKDPLILRAKK